MTLPTPNLAAVIESATYRRVIYGAYVVLLVAAGTTNAVYGVLPDPTPTWLLAANAGLIYLGIPVGGLALANAPKPGTPPLDTGIVEVVEVQDDDAEGI